MHGQQSGMGMATRCKHSYTLSDNLYIFLSDTTLSKQHLYKKKYQKTSAGQNWSAFYNFYKHGSQISKDWKQYLGRQVGVFTRQIIKYNNQIENRTIVSKLFPPHTWQEHCSWIFIQYFHGKRKQGVTCTNSGLVKF